MSQLRTLTVFILSIAFAQSIAQEQTQLPMPEVPLTPEATAFAKYGDVPINHSTGALSLQIPIYDLKLKNYTVPIRLNYHGSGFKVDEIASDVGLGWTLEGYGLVSQGVRGLRDDLVNPSGYSSADDILQLVDDDNFHNGGNNYVCLDGPCALGTLTETNNKPENQDEVFFGGYDAEVDIFNYNYPGGSGKFYRDRNGQFKSVSYEDIDIVALANGGFEITDERGIVYTFTEGEVLTINATCRDVDLFYTNRKLENFSPNHYLSSICLPQGGCIDYEYESYSYSYYGSITQSDYSKVSSGGSLKGISTCYNKTIITDGRKLSRIRSDNGLQIVFDYEDEQRADLPPASNALLESGRLERVTVIANDQTVKTIDLTHTYSSGNNDDQNNAAIIGIPGSHQGRASKRLMLKEVIESGKNPYKFEYTSDNNANVLPTRFSFARDFWGYYNGQHQNPNLVPMGIIQGSSIGDANREPSETNMDANMITKVIYPTGGYTSFTFEPHQRIVYLRSDGGCTETIENRSVSMTSLGNQGPNTETFTITENSFDIWATYSTNVPEDNTTQIDPVHGEPFSQCIIFSQHAFTGFSFNQALPLPPGTHELSLWTNGVIGFETNGDPIPSQTSVTISWKERVIDCTNGETSKKTLLYGGLRLKNSTDIPYLNSMKSENIFKRYEYQYGLVNNDIYDKNDNYQVMLGHHFFNTYVPAATTGTPNCVGTDAYFGSPANEYIQYLTLSSESQRNLSFANGTNLIYGLVTEIYGPPQLAERGSGSDFLVGNAEIQGKKVYQFSNKENIKRGITGIYSEDDFSFLNGSLSQEIEFAFDPVTGRYSPVRIKKYYYSESEDDSPIWNLKVSRTHAPFRLGDGSIPGCPGVYPKYSYTFYKIPRVRRELIKTTEEILPGSFSSESIFHHSNTHLQLSKSSQRINSNSKLTSHYLYPRDLLTHAPIYGSLSAKNYNQPIYTYQILSTSDSPDLELTPVMNFLMAITRGDYVINGQGEIRLNGITSAEFAEPLEGSAIFDAQALDLLLSQSSNSTNLVYNTFGNAIEVEKNGEHQSFIWAPNNRDIIAKVSNARSSQVYYESFEYSGISGDAKSGSKYLNSGSYTIANPPPGSGLKMSYWYWTSGKWNYSGELDFSSVINSGGSRLDEIRVYPEHGLMTTYTYDSGVGIKSVTDPNGLTNYYEYDEGNRLKSIEDDDHNLVQLFKYNYQPQN